MSRTVVGVHTPPIPCLTDALPHVLMVVLVQDDVNGTQVAYQGIVFAPSPRHGNSAVITAVAARGAKLTYEEAQRHFPALERERYQL